MDTFGGNRSDGGSGESSIWVQERGIEVVGDDDAFAAERIMRRKLISETSVGRTGKLSLHVLSGNVSYVFVPHALRIISSVEDVFAVVHEGCTIAAAGKGYVFVDGSRPAR